MVAESGTYHGAVTMDKAKADFDKLIGKLNCSVASSPVECARSAAAADIESAVKAPLSGAVAGWTWGPTIDGVSLSGEPWELIEQGKHNTEVPVILGSNRDESAIGLFLYPLPMTEAEFDVVAKRVVAPRSWRR